MNKANLNKSISDDWMLQEYNLKLPNDLPSKKIKLIGYGYKAAYQHSYKLFSGIVDEMIRDCITHMPIIGFSYFTEAQKNNIKYCFLMALRDSIQLTINEINANGQNNFN